VNIVLRRLHLYRVPGATAVYPY